MTEQRVRVICPGIFANLTGRIVERDPNRPSVRIVFDQPPPCPYPQAGNVFVEGQYEVVG